MQKLYRMVLVPASLVGLGAAASPALAQTDGAAASDTPQIDDIVVTARRREETLQNVPVTITALSGDALEQKSVHSTEDLRNLVPGLNISGNKRDDANFYVRGQGPGNLTTGVRNFAGVATYFAEVPTQIAGPGVFYDLQNIQVLKGPQGTLFGRNTTGGAVLLEPRQPLFENSGSLQLQAGNYNLKQLNLVLNVNPVPDVLAIRVAAEITRRDGFTQSIYTGQKLDGRRYEAVRGSIRFKPTDRLESLTIVDYRNRDQSGTGQIIRAINTSVNLGGTVGGNPQLAALADLGAFAGLTTQQVLGIPLTSGGGANIGCLSAQLAGCPTPLSLPGPFASFGGIAATLAAAYAGGGLGLIGTTAELNNIVALQKTLGARRSQQDQLYYNRSLDYGITNKTMFELTNEITLKNIIAYRKSRSNFSFDFDGTPAPFLTALYTNQLPWALGSEQFTDEFQVQGRLPSLKTNFIVGGYYEHEKPGFVQQTAALFAGSGPSAYQNRLLDHNDISNAIFAHIEVNPADYLSFAGGLRQSWDKRTSASGTVNFAGGCIQVDPRTGALDCNLTYSGKFKALTYDATVSVKPMAGVMVYGAYRHGYKSGGFNLPAPNGPPGDPLQFRTYDPEYVNEWEVGLKADFNIGIPVRIDVAGFIDNYKNRQTGQTVNFSNADGSISPVIVILNNVNAKNQGVEASLTALPAPGLNLSGFFSFLDAHFLNTIADPTSGLIVVQAERQFANQPKWKYGLSGSYQLPLGENIGPVTLSADWAWQSQFFNQDALNSLVPINPAYGVLNARVTWEKVMGSRIDLSVFGTNVLDKTYVLGGFPIAQLGFDAAIYGEPRMYGMSVKYSF